MKNFYEIFKSVQGKINKQKYYMIIITNKIGYALTILCGYVPLCVYIMDIHKGKFKKNNKCMLAENYYVCSKLIAYTIMFNVFQKKTSIIGKQNMEKICKNMLICFLTLSNVRYSRYLFLIKKRERKKDDDQVKMNE